MTLYQIPISHNCVKVRTALALKHLAFTRVDIPPTDRSAVREVSGQGLVPVLRDGDTVIADSTQILLHLEECYPDPPLVPADPAARAECLVLEDWADRSLMALSRRLAYWSILAKPGMLLKSWNEPARGVRARIKERIVGRIVRRRFGLSADRNRDDEAEARQVAALAIDRLGARPFLVGGAITIADITLAAMAAPLRIASPAVTGDPAVARLLAWVPTILATAGTGTNRREA